MSSAPDVPAPPRPLVAIDPQTMPWLLAGAVVLYLFLRPPQAVPQPQPLPPPSPVVPYQPVPPTDPVARVLAGYPAEANELAEFFAAGAELVASTSVPSTGALRDAYSQAGRSAFAGWQGRFPGLAQAIDEQLKSTLGLDDKPLDAASRDAASRAFSALAGRLREVR